MDPVRNPYVPGAGAPPPELTGREGLLEQARVTLERVRRGKPAKSFIAVGLRGVGKTVLLNRVRRVAETAEYRVSMIEAHEQKRLPELLVPHLRRQLLELDRLGALNEHVKRALRVLSSFMSGLKLRYGDAELALDIDPERGAADSGDIEADLPELLAATGRAAAARGTALALLIDEIQYLSEPDMSALIMSLHRTMQDSLPVVMIAAGLPQVVGLSGRSKSYAERLFDFPAVSALGEADAIRALAAPAAEEGVQYEDAALREIVAITRGYPYFLQEWGYHAWNSAAASPITRADVETATAAALRRLDESFFRVRFDRLTPREKDYLRAMAALGAGPHRSGDIADRLGVSVQSVGPLRSGLIGKGMIYSPAHGETAFTVPLFDEYLHRIMPAWHPGRTA
ncbi:MAG TPA: ATP-binding protein [Acetobacteraceae bacterium]|nr:ATP-binding protein [Acetobacteraceae bacterium]